MRNKFKIILPDGTKYKAPKNSMIIMNTDGVVFLATDLDWSGWSLRRLSEVVPVYYIAMEIL